MKNLKLLIITLLENFVPGYGRVLSLLLPIFLVFMSISVGRGVFIVDNWPARFILFLIALFFFAAAIISFILRKKIAEF